MWREASTGLTEYETEEEPGGEVDARGGRHEDGAGESDGDVDVLDPGIGIPLGEPPRDDGSDGAGEEPPKDGVVKVTNAELTSRADESPRGMWQGKVSNPPRESKVDRIRELTR